MCVGFEPNAALYARTSDLIFFNSGALPNILHYITYITLHYPLCQLRQLGNHVQIVVNKDGFVHKTCIH